MPKRVNWENIDDIVAILNIIGDYKDVNHTLFPTGGGLDLRGAKVSHEDGCIELRFDMAEAVIVKPKLLAFESFRDNLNGIISD